jgi:hypothetical protein
VRVKTRTTAWLVVILAAAPNGPRVVGAKVFSEPHPTVTGERTTAVLVELEGETYEEAKRNCLEYAALHFPWLEVTP